MAPRKAEDNQRIRTNRAREIREAALELFGTRGYHNTTINDVARQVGISKGLMYNYFSGKEDLLRAIVEAMIDESSTFAEELDKLKTPLEKIDATIAYSVRAIEKRPEEARMLLSLIIHRDSMQHISAYSAGATREMIRWFQEIFREAGIADAETETWLLVSALDGLALHYLYFGDKPDYPWEAIKAKFIEKTLKHFKL